MGAIIRLSKTSPANKTNVLRCMIFSLTWTKRKNDERRFTHRLCHWCGY
jgi:hypothetical protein